MRRLILLLFILHVSFQNYGQQNKIPGHVKKKNYCNWTSCTLKPDDPAHFNPYYSGHLCENFNPEQIDFSKEYLKLETKHFARTSNILKQILKYDFSRVWLTYNTEQNGFLGPTYQRIRIHIDKVTASKSSDTYIVNGASNVANNICRFRGTIKLIQAFLYDSCDNSTYLKCGDLFAEYIFYQDSLQNSSGVFKGVTECMFHIDSNGQYVLLDESMDGADFYWNRSFVGTLREYKTGITKKCIWGDDRLPFSFDLDCGDGEMIIRDKYKKNGWQTFGEESEWKQKWWQVKK